MVSISTSEFRRGLKIEMEGVPYAIVDLVHIQQKRRAVIKTKLRNILTGSISEYTFLNGDKVERPDVEERVMEYLYHDGDHYYFMDQESFEQTTIDEHLVEDVALFMRENEKITVQFYNGRPISVELPQFVELEVAETEPGVRGDTVTNTWKAAKMSTGGTVQVPLFVNAGDVIRINTVDNFKYVERVKK